MRIGVRITGGFALVMLVTLTVALVGWLGLATYSRRVATSSLAQSMVQDIGRLDFATAQVVRGGNPALAAAALAQVKRRTALLFSPRFEKRFGRTGTEEMQTSIAAYEKSMDAYAVKQATKASVLAQRRAVAEQLADVAGKVLTLQAAQFQTAIGQLGSTAIDLTATTHVLQFGLQFKDALSDVRDQTSRFIRRRDKASRNVVLLKLQALEAALTGIALRLPSEDGLWPVLSAAARFRSTLSAPGPLHETALLREFDLVQRAGDTLFASFGAGMADAVDGLNEARDLAATAASARQTAQQIILVDQQATAAEREFLRDEGREGGRDAAERVRLATVEMQRLVRILTGNVADPLLHRTLKDLRTRIADYGIEFGAVVAAQAAQAALLSDIHASMDNMLNDADTLNREQLRGMIEARAQASLVIITGTGLALLIGVVLSYLIASSIIRPLSRIVAVMRRLAGGELVTEIPGGNRRDELREVADAVKVFRDNAIAMDSLRQKLDRARLQQLAEVSFEGIIIHQAGRIVNVNEALCAMLGRPKCHLIGHDLTEFVTPACLEWIEQGQQPGPVQTVTGEAELIDSGRRAIPVEVHARRIDYSGKPATAMALRDLTARRQTEATLIHLAGHDPLTGLPNRLLLNERLTKAITTASRDQGAVVVLCVDLDRFKAVNDQFGHAAGDELLIQVSQRLESMLRTTDTVARMGGDEFALVLTSDDRAHSADAFCQRIVHGLSLPFAILGKQVVIGASVGAAVYPAHGGDVSALLRSADIAMYCAKANGRNTYRFYDAAMDEQLRLRRALEGDLRQAIEGNELELHYQPLVCCRSGEIEGFEALARWNHPGRGHVSPVDFISIAEETGQIDRLGRWALQAACAEAATWDRPLQVAVNLSPMQFRQNDLAQQISTILARTGLPAERLDIEVTESVLFEHPEQALRLLSEIKSLGVRISLDDFGTGYSSLNYLQRFPFDKIKIDRSFIEELGKNEQAIAIVRAIIALGQTLKLVVIAEGVETSGQFDLLCAEKCGQVQGYLMGRPMPQHAISALVREPIFAPIRIHEGSHEQHDGRPSALASRRRAVAS